MPSIDSWFGAAVCGFATGLGAFAGHVSDAINLCIFIATNDL